jgi:hypothetical protein
LDDAGWKEVKGKRVNKLTNNKPTTGCSTHNKNEFQALSTSIDHNPDLPCDNNAVAAAAVQLSKAIKKKKQEMTPAHKHV